MLALGFGTDGGGSGGPPGPAPPAMWHFWFVTRSCQQTQTEMSQDDLTKNSSFSRGHPTISPGVSQENNHCILRSPLRPKGSHGDTTFTSTMENGCKCGAEGWSLRKPEFGLTHDKAGCPLWLAVALTFLSGLLQSAVVPEAPLRTHVWPTCCASTWYMTPWGAACRGQAELGWQNSTRSTEAPTQFLSSSTGQNNQAEFGD